MLLECPALADLRQDVSPLDTDCSGVMACVGHKSTQVSKFSMLTRTCATQGSFPGTRCYETRLVVVPQELEVARVQLFSVVHHSMS